MTNERTPGGPVLVLSGKQVADGYVVLHPGGRIVKHRYVILAVLDNGLFEVVDPRPSHPPEDTAA